MSLARQIFREMRPLFRMLEEPLTRSPNYFGAMPTLNRLSFDDTLTRPAIDVSDQGNEYVVEADLPGVKKDNVQVRIGDNGRSVTIEGKVTERGGATSSETKDQATSANTTKTSDSTSVPKPDIQNGTQLTTERAYTRNVSFTRTVWLPRPVDSKDVEAKLDHGVLRITFKKAEDKASTVIPIQD